MADSYALVIAALQGHARTLSDLSRDLSGVHTTAESNELTSDAYGETAQQAAALIRGHTFAGQVTLEAAVAALDDAVANVRANIAEYEERERKNAEELNRAGGRR